MPKEPRIIPSKKETMKFYGSREDLAMDTLDKLNEIRHELHRNQKRADEVDARLKQLIEQHKEHVARTGEELSPRIEALAKGAGEGDTTRLMDDLAKEKDRLDSELHSLGAEARALHASKMDMADRWGEHHKTLLGLLDEVREHAELTGEQPPAFLLCIAEFLGKGWGPPIVVSTTEFEKAKKIFESGRDLPPDMIETVRQKFREAGIRDMPSEEINLLVKHSVLREAEFRKKYLELATKRWKKEQEEK